MLALLHSVPPDLLPVEVGVVLGFAILVSIPVSVSVSVSITILALAILVRALLLLIVRLFLLSFKFLPFVCQSVCCTHSGVARRIFRKDTLGGHADDVFADHEQQVGCWHKGPFLRRVRAARRRRLRGEELERSIAGSFRCCRPLRDILPECCTDLPNIWVSPRNRRVESTREDRTQPPSPLLRPRRRSGPRVIIPQAASLLLVRLLLLLGPRPDPNSELLVEIPQQADLRELHHDSLPISSDTVVLPLGLSTCCSVQGAEELCPEFLLGAIVGGAHLR
mmetsp:Transcript_19630/g.29374  ORF Transcript_19630/g.29374 Transcript_19630/m.29374 type:complete len:279 (-) Transcript_19630:397-1233(-)